MCILRKSDTCRVCVCVCVYIHTCVTEVCAYTVTRHVQYTHTHT